MRPSTRTMLAAVAAAATVATSVAAPASAAKPAPTTGTVRVTSVSASMSGVRTDPTGHNGCLLTVSATVANAPSTGTLTFWVALGDVGGVPVSQGPFAYVPLVAGQTQYSATPAVWFERTTTVTSVGARIYNGRRLVTGLDQKVSMVCPTQR